METECLPARTVREYLLKNNSFLLVLIISLSFFIQTPEVKCATYEADDIPWSGYWWPKTQGGLVTGEDYRGHPAPLEKYDYVTTGTYEGPATQFGKERHYSPDAVPWEGLCFCWSAASILEEEPVHKSVYKGILFRIGDKKGLLTAAYYGALYNIHSTDTPAEFHEILEEFIAHQKIPVILDIGTDGESWNHPVFKYDTNYTRDGSTRHYTTMIYYADDHVEPDFIGTEVRTKIYHYYFVSDEDGNITEDGWENETTPPVMAYEPFGTSPRNPDLDYDTVKEIVSSTDDPYEENNSLESASPLSAGTHTMIGTDSDYFRVDLKRNDKVNIRAVSETGNDISLKTYTPEGILIQETADSEEQFISTEDTPGTYFFEIIPINPSAEPDYELILRHDFSYQGIFPLYPAGQWESEISLLTPNKNPFTKDRITISLVNQDGTPRTVFTDISLKPHLIGMPDEDFGLPPVTGNEYIKVDSDTPFRGTQVATAENFDLMLGANFISLDKASAELFFPHFAKKWGWKTIFGIINTGNRTREISLDSYDQDGYILASDTLELAPGQKWERDTLHISILTSDARTMSASALGGANCLTGYTTFLNPTIGSAGRALVPLTPGGPALVIPHIASDDHWWTGIAVMNTGEEDSTILFSAYDTQGNLTGLSEYVLNAKQNFVYYAPDIFPDAPAEDIASITIVSQDDQPLCGLLLYGTTDEFQLAGLPIRPPAASSLYLPHILCSDPWWTGIGITNADDIPAEITFTLFEGNGKILSTKTSRMNPNQQMAVTVKELFDDVSPDARYMKIESDNGQLMSGIYLIGTNDGRQLMGDVLEGNSKSQYPNSK
ncbi:PPC domain-containing protein [Desulfococcaceae bacterium HSG8]|nr:PPC domain-containing protein [Desulfococcaceae bacterium HSG8]